MGEVWPSAKPTKNGRGYGRAWLDSAGPVEVRSYQQFRLVYEVGILGIDDTGGIAIAQRFMNDGGPFQSQHPDKANYVTAKASNECQLNLECRLAGMPRPWQRHVRITLNKGFMKPGNQIEVLFGDQSQGSPGLLMQTFCESVHEFRVVVDACATGLYIPIEQRVWIPVVAGPGIRWKLVLPTHKRINEPFYLGVKCEDLWGNPACFHRQLLELEAVGPSIDLPDKVELSAGMRSLRVNDLRASSNGEYRIQARNQDGEPLAVSNPLVVEDHDLPGFWGDLHGQSGESVGVNSIEEYFAFGRDLAFLDVMCHQANDFQITDAFWHKINALSDDLNDDGRFVVFPGYEWSGNTPVGGDHNVIFCNGGHVIRRSSNALIKSDGTPPPTISTKELFHQLADEDCVILSHVGGRPSDMSQADGRHLRTAVEIHSDWGTFEWLMLDSFRLGYRLGLVCNSDGHKGRPGASYPGSSTFGAYGGLTCFLTDELSREGIFRSLRQRHHYGTTGCRMYLAVSGLLNSPGKVYGTDPRLGKGEFDVSKTFMKGDIVGTTEATALVKIKAVGHAPIMSAEVRNGAEVVSRIWGHSERDLGCRIRVFFEGAEYRGRGRQTRWHGSLRVVGSTIDGMAKINVWNHERTVRLQQDNKVIFDLVTTGNFVGFDLRLSNIKGSKLVLECNRLKETIKLDILGLEPFERELGGLGRKLSVLRLPDQSWSKSLDADVMMHLRPGKDNPVWVKVTTEDGFNAWSSPMYLIDDQPA